jgi:hypothetical protein
LFGDPVAPTTPAVEPAPATSETPAPTSETPAAETPAAGTPAPSDQTPPATEPANADAPKEEPKAEEELDFDALFGPSSSNETLSEPGGWASDAGRQWSDAHGAELATARVTSIGDHNVTLVTAAGEKLNVSFAELSDGDLAFLRRQIDARQTLLAERERAEARLADQSR